MIYADLGADAEYVGEWYLSASGEKIPGTLRRYNGQLKLLLQRPMFPSGKRDAVHGRCTRLPKHGEAQEDMQEWEIKNTDVTLLDVSTGDGLRYGAYAAIFGGMQDDDRRLGGISFSFDILHEWARPSTPYHSDGSADGGGFEETERLEFTHDKAVCALAIYHRVRIHAHEGRHDSHESGFAVKVGDGMELQDLMGRYVRSMDSFLRIAMGRNLNLAYVNRIDGKELPILVSVSRSPATLDDLDHLVGLEDMRRDFADIMGEWMRFYARNKYIIDLFANTTNTPDVGETDFFVYASLLEGYAKYKYESSPEFEYESCDSRGQKGDSMYKMRIGKVLEPFRGDFGNMNEFVDNVHSMRNDLFHANRMETVDADLRDRITHDLYFLIRIILLNETGLNLSVDSSQYRLNFAFLERKKSAGAIPAGVENFPSPATRQAGTGEIFRDRQNR